MQVNQDKLPDNLHHQRPSQLLTICDPPDDHAVLRCPCLQVDGVKSDYGIRGLCCFSIPTSFAWLYTQTKGNVPGTTTFYFDTFSTTRATTQFIQLAHPNHPTYANPDHAIYVSRSRPNPAPRNSR
ncbi:9290_t:CDS:2, partial [Ambispora leptoticha]